VRRRALDLLALGWPGRALALLSPTEAAFARAGERLAERRLRRAGWRLLARRRRTPWAEIDLLFHDGRQLVLVEVKTGRLGPRFRPGQRLGRDPLRRLWRAAAELGRRQGSPARVDLFEVGLERARGGVLCRHFPGLRDPLGPPEPGPDRPRGEPF